MRGEASFDAASPLTPHRAPKGVFSRKGRAGRLLLGKLGKEYKAAVGSEDKPEPQRSGMYHSSTF
jgi:hypothetical protein